MVPKNYNGQGQMDKMMEKSLKFGKWSNDIYLVDKSHIERDNQDK